MAEELKESIPEPTEDLSAVQDTDTIPDTAPEITVPVKFNKEIKNLTLTEAGNLAQKGMKFDMISSDYERIKVLAKENGSGVSEYLTALERQRSEERIKSLTERCGGNEEIAQHIMKLEQSASINKNNGFCELQENFPEIKELSDVPEEVLENASLKGTNLLDEFLRYRMLMEREKSEIARSYKNGKNSSIGSQSSATVRNASADGFLKGLWG